LKRFAISVCCNKFLEFAGMMESLAKITTILFFLGEDINA
jgi:hypothetical protein